MTKFGHLSALKKELCVHMLYLGVLVSYPAAPFLMGPLKLEVGSLRLWKIGCKLDSRNPSNGDIRLMGGEGSLIAIDSAKTKNLVWLCVIGTTMLELARRNEIGTYRRIFGVRRQFKECSPRPHIGCGCGQSPWAPWETAAKLVDCFR